MKKLSLLMFALLILGCGNETPVVEEPPPVVWEYEPPNSPRIKEGSVRDGDVDVDPELLNQEGITFRFTASLYTYAVDLRANPGRSLL